ncbi:hypothetical protein NDU88_002023 [Pleurodeles waltl]|uniref:Uncharacterized protein n=1 Tax=Pleurodeles waltl TaxID=8319 RepID=A0AAV7W1R6_PLEWA|nr:hypothetical protein NDU88_002023 [Pleurodeles waltl]
MKEGYAIYRDDEIAAQFGDVYCELYAAQSTNPETVGDCLQAANITCLSGSQAEELDQPIRIKEGCVIFSAWALAQLSPPQPAADHRYTAHLNQGSGGAPPQGTLFLRLLRCPGESQGVLLSKQLGRRSSLSRRY